MTEVITDPEMFYLSISVRGPARTVKTSYGERTDRETLASFEGEVSPHAIWQLYIQSLLGAIKDRGETSGHGAWRFHVSEGGGA